MGTTPQLGVPADDVVPLDGGAALAEFAQRMQEWGGDQDGELLEAVRVAGSVGRALVASTLTAAVPLM